MSIRIALAGNPNSGKTTLFNELTGANQYVGNWPGVTVEKKEGKIKKHDDAILVDLPGIYSLSPYTQEEVIARNYLLKEKPDVILNIVDATNLERNLYLTTQLIEIGIPVVVALNMMDIVKKDKDILKTKELAKRLGCRIVEISALKGMGLSDVVDAALEAARCGKVIPYHNFSGVVEHAIAHIEEAVFHDIPENEQRWYAIKVFERDEKVLKSLSIKKEILDHIEKDIEAAEKELDDDAESIITNERYLFIANVLKDCHKIMKTGLSVSDKIDRVVTNKWLALPIFAVVMFIVYFISWSTVGVYVTDWTNDGLFGDGYFLLGIGAKKYEKDDGIYNDAENIIGAYIAYGDEHGLDTGIVKDALDFEKEGFSPEAAKGALDNYIDANKTVFTDDFETEYVIYDDETLKDEIKTANVADYRNAAVIMFDMGFIEPNPKKYGPFLPGIPVLMTKFLDKIKCWAPLKSLIIDGIIAGLGAVLGFVPQLFVLFFFLAFLELCGYMSRVAFVLDRIFRRFGLSGKSFIPMLISTGCAVPGIMASRTIESEHDRKMTILTTTFIPCSAKLPFILMMAGAIFADKWWVAPSAYFLGMAAVIISGIMLKKTKLFAGDPAPFVMELPDYRMPTMKSVARSMWDRGWSFIKKAGTIILLSTIVIWFTTYFGFVGKKFRMLAPEEIDSSLLAYFGKAFAWLFAPLGFGTWQATVASVTGLVAKENIVGTMGILFNKGIIYQNISAHFATKLAGYSFLAFNLLCAPCFAAIGAIRREMNSRKWTWIAILYQTAFAYAASLIIYQFGNLFTGNLQGPLNIVFFIVAFVVLGLIVYFLVKKPAKPKEKSYA